MAQLRLAVLAAVLVSGAGCRASQADSRSAGSGLTPPNGWQALPTLAEAASDAAKEAAITVHGVEAWGETARGCYAAWIGLRGTGGTPDATAEQLVASLSVEPALMGIVIRDVVKPVAGAQSGVLSLSFSRALYRGKLRATLTRDGAIAALACFWNNREPVACDQACTAMIGSMK